jgi:hypothetical protein
VRALSFRQAASCEAAVSARCRCRCAGAFHGTLREVGDLRQGDPHALKDADSPEPEVVIVIDDEELEREEQLRWEAISRAAMDEAAADARARVSLGAP